MRYGMKVLRLLLVVVLVSSLMGCSFVVLKGANAPGKGTPEPADEGQVETVEEEPVVEETGPEDIVEASPKEENPTVEEPPAKETPKSGKVLDYEILDRLDNTKYSWGLKLNSEHKTPEIPSYVVEMLKDHAGIFTGDTSQKVVYLTFDEGYENGYTAKILDVLKENDVKSIFFITGSYLERNPELVRRMLEEGHEVGNHSVNHPSLPDVDNERLERELLGLEEKFYSEFNRNFKYFRPPNGEYSRRTLEAAKQMGYKNVFWSFAYKDWDVNDQKGADYAYNKVMDNLHNGAVILLHAVSKDNAEALDRIIKGIREEGYEIRPFDL